MTSKPTWTQYTCRAELNCDIPSVKKAMEKHGIEYIDVNIKKGTFLGKPFPGGRWTFSSTSSLDELLCLMNRVPNAHVMVETLEKTEDYTGERKFERSKTLRPISKRRRSSLELTEPSWHRAH